MADAPDKARRHRAILSILERRSIASQDDLLAALEERGIFVTQSTLSRDLRDLGISRVPTERGYRYAPPGDAPEEAMSRSARQRLHSLAPIEVVGVDANEVAVIVRTLIGRAQGVAVYIDGLGLEDVLATVAGDDTILVLPRTVRRVGRLRKRLRDLLGAP